MKADNPFKKVKGQAVLGSENFIAMIQPLFDGQAEISEIPRHQRVAGRPDLDELLAGVEDRQIRNARIVEVVEHWGYSQKEVADRLGMHYSAISRIVKNARIKT